MKGVKEPVYPVTGLYEARGATVRLRHGEPHLEDEWTFRKLDGRTTLWRPNAVKWWDKGSFDHFGVLYRTDLDAEYVSRNQSVVNR